MQEVADNNDEELALDLPARSINVPKSYTDCPLKWQLEWEVPRYSEYSDSYWGDWDPIRGDENIELDLEN
jgi:hypothetical protein